MPGVGISASPFIGSKASPPFKFVDAADLLLLDASAETGLSNGAHMATITDRSGAGHSFTQGTDAARPTYDLAELAYAFSGSQFASTASGIITSLAAWSFVWVGKFDSVAAAATAIFFGTNATDGLDWNAHRNSNHKFGVFCRTVGAVDTDLAADTGWHIAQVSYASASSPKWHIYIDGTERTLSSANVTPANPSGLSVVGATNTVPQVPFAGKQGLIMVATGVHDATTRAKIRALAKATWSNLP